MLIGARKNKKYKGSNVFCRAVANDLFRKREFTGAEKLYSQLAKSTC